VNFGATNCQGNDGRNRRGALVTIAFTGKYRDSLTVITVTPQNYFVDDNQVTGSKTITNKGHNAAHHLVYEINANIQIIKANAAGINFLAMYSSTRVDRRINLMHGRMMFTQLQEVLAEQQQMVIHFASNITSPLIRNMAIGCRRHFVQGKLRTYARWKSN
jgi:hypothetical protein